MLPVSILRDILKLFHRFAQTDYAFAYALCEAVSLCWLVLSYDIWCQYSVNLWKCFSKWFKNFEPIAQHVRGAMPKTHVKNHVLKCQQLYSFNYLPHVGETWGENTESGWTEQNQTARSTKEQNNGHHHNTLDNFNGHWNWTKLHQMGASKTYLATNWHEQIEFIAATLHRMYTNCLSWLDSLKKKFDGLTASHPTEYVARWGSMDATPCVVSDEVISVYEVQVKDGMFISLPQNYQSQISMNRSTMQGKAYQKLVQDELTVELAGSGKLACNAQFINTGLQIEHDQCVYYLYIHILEGYWLMLSKTEKRLGSSQKMQRRTRKASFQNVSNCGKCSSSGELLSLICTPSYVKKSPLLIHLNLRRKSSFSHHLSTNQYDLRLGWMILPRLNFYYGRARHTMH